jgi:serine/threonine-protein phosphatase 4 regulatory subunit 1
LREFIRPPPNRKAFEEFFIPALDKLAEDLVDVRLGLALLIADLFVIGAFYGDRQLPIPGEIQDLADKLSRDSAEDVRDIIVRIGADRWGKDVSAQAALVQEMRERTNPEVVHEAIRGALDSQGPVGRKLSSPVLRAALASPMPVPARPREASLDLDAELDPASADEDPFASSFARAASRKSG